MAKRKPAEEASRASIGIDLETYERVAAYRRKLDVGMGAPPLYRVIQSLIVEGLASFERKRRPS
jgi:hypothetical protein